MKKKVIAGILALSCAMACACAFAACGGSNDPAKMKSGKVTEAQWKAAFNADNFKNVKIVTKTTTQGEFFEDGKDDKMIVTTTMVIADGKEYFKNEAKVEVGSDALKEYAAQTIDYEEYSSVTAGNYAVTYAQYEGKWELRIPNSLGVVSDRLTGYFAAADWYDKFEYMEIGNGGTGYTLKYDYVTNDTYSYLVNKFFKFKNGKLAAIFHDYGTKGASSESVGVTKFETTEITYGGQSVPLPTADVGAVGAYVGTWKTKQLIIIGQESNSTINLGGSIPGGTLTEDYLKIVANNDGTATFTGPDGSGSGIWGIESLNRIAFCSQDLDNANKKYIEYYKDAQTNEQGLTMYISDDTAVVLGKE